MDASVATQIATELDAAGALFAQAAQRLPEGRDRAREWLDLAEASLREARRLDEGLAGLLAVTHGRALLAAALLARAPSVPALRRDPAGELLLQACVRLLRAEERLEEDDEPPDVEAPELPLDRYPMERCAAMAARIHRRPEEAPAILEAEALDGPLWSRLMAHWEAVMEADIKRGKGEVVGRWDEAYVAQVERDRGDISVEDYVALKVAAGRGALASALAALKIPRPAVMCIERVWLARLVGSDALRRLVRQAYERERAG